MNIKHSMGRTSVIDSLDMLCSPDYHKKWLSGDDLAEWHFECIVHALLDDWNILQRRFELIGDKQEDIFVNKEEAEAVIRATRFFDEMFNRLGDKPARVFVKDSRWNELVLLAKEARGKIKELR